jgi:hypothetical protein
MVRIRDLCNVGIRRAGQSAIRGETMKPNLGSIDRIVRGVAGIGLIAWALTGGPVWAWIGVVFLATAIISWCPLYRLLGISTLGTK